MDKKILDCESIGSTYDSLEKITNISTEDIKTFLTEFDLDNYFDSLQDTEKDWGDRLILRIFKSEFNPSLDYDSTCWFHGCRTYDSSKFELGILPLGGVIEELWDFLFNLVDDKISRDKWSNFRLKLETDLDNNFAHLYRLKIRDSFHYGPYAYLIRDVIFIPKKLSQHDYLNTPEIVEDICNCYKDFFDFDLLKEYQINTEGCIVKFKSDDSCEENIGDALFYLYDVMNGIEMSDRCCTACNNKGKKIPKKNILRIEFVDKI